MKAVYITQKTGPEGLIRGEIPTPSANADEVLVRVKATAITPTEFDWFPTFQQPSGEPRPFPIVLSHELSGVVEAVGVKVNSLKVGDAVYGLNDWFSNGAQAEYCVATVSGLAQKPASLNDGQSAVVPISALTAWQGLFERCGLSAGQRVLIHGAAGGVGVFAVQMARARGAQVIATASSTNLEFVRQLGANEVIDYRTTRFEDAARDVDVIFDGVGGETLDRSWPVLKPGGQLVTIVSQSGGNISQRNRDAFLLVRADGSQLAEIAKLIDDGKLKVFMEETFPLARSREAYARAKLGRMRGKIALRVTD
jgi:NADPH:quinone reductase-like Zn-dependent oxidoreductase